MSLRFAVGLVLCGLGPSVQGGEASEEVPLFDYLTGDPPAVLIAYTPLDLDPRQPANNVAHPTSELRADLAALRPTFDGLVLYGYHEATTPRILALARDLKFRAVLLGIWQPKSAAEVDGVVGLVERYHEDLALGVIVGNEGVTFGRYETEDIAIAATRLRRAIPADVPLTTSEPHVGYEKEAIRTFGDFLAPNIHPVFDRPSLEADAAAAWARTTAITLARETGKPLLLKETGFPHDGKPAYTPATQARFWSAYVAPGTVVPPPEPGDPWVSFGVAFEAFDLAWKAEASGLPIEKSWGLLSAERKPYPALDAWKRVSKPSPR